MQGATNIYYTLSEPVDACTGLAGGACIPGSTLTGDNSVSWDGEDSTGVFLQSGQYPVSFSTTPLSGPRLSLSNIQCAASFTPENDQTLQISYTLAEPVVRPQATGAYLYAFVFDDLSGDVVKTLSNGDAVSINNLSGSSSGQNTLSWDGTDESGEDLVEPGGYTITLTAKDNAGVGCESPLWTVPIEVLPGNSDCFVEINDSDDDNQTSVAGSTNSGSSVTWSDSLGGGGTVAPDENGNFNFEIDNAPGLHIISLTTSDPQSHQAVQGTGEIFVNNVALTSLSAVPGPTSPEDNSRFDTTQGQSLCVAFTSGADDTFNVTVINFLDARTCISSADPIPASDLLNGSLVPAVIRTIWDHHQVSAGSMTVTWDGKDDNGNFVAAGPYYVEVSRSNDDGLRSIQFETVATVTNSGTLPAISNVSASLVNTTAAVAWMTSVPTTGYVLYSDADSPVACAESAQSTYFHTIYLPVATPATTYNYWIVATDSAGNVSVSPKETITTASGEAFSDVSLSAVSSAGCSVSWSTIAIANGKISYAIVGPSVETLNWQVASEPSPTTNHLVSLTNLSPNAEYIFE